MEKLIRSLNEISKYIELTMALFELDEALKSGQSTQPRSFTNSRKYNKTRVSRAVGIYAQSIEE